MHIFAIGTKIFGGRGWPTFAGACAPGPNVEPPLAGSNENIDGVFVAVVVDEQNVAKNDDETRGKA